MLLDRIDKGTNRVPMEGQKRNKNEELSNHNPLNHEKNSNNNIIIPLNPSHEWIKPYMYSPFKKAVFFAIPLVKIGEKNFCLGERCAST